MKLPEIIGVSGTNASGKDTLGILRQTLQNTKMTSLSDILRHELDNRGLPHERDNLRAVGNEWRAEGGPGILVDKTIELYRQEKVDKGYTGLTLTSIRHPGEAAAVKAAGGIIIWVDADRRVRYERIHNRLNNRPTDQKTFEEFVAEEESEMKPTDGLDMEGVRDMADVTIINEFDSVAAYEDYLKKEFELS